MKNIFQTIRGFNFVTWFSILIVLIIVCSLYLISQSKEYAMGTTSIRAEINELKAREKQFNKDVETKIEKLPSVYEKIEAESEELLKILKKLASFNGEEKITSNDLQEMESLKNQLGQYTSLQRSWYENADWKCDVKVGQITTLDSIPVTFTFYTTKKEIAEVVTTTYNTDVEKRSFTDVKIYVTDEGVDDTPRYID